MLRRQQYFGQRLASHLKAHQAEAYARLYGLWIWHKLVWFAVLRRDRPFGDGELTLRTRQYKLVYLCAVGSWLIIFALAIAGVR